MFRRMPLTHSGSDRSAAVAPALLNRSHAHLREHDQRGSEWVAPIPSICVA
ncbi:hypothetical protein PF003_g24862 [Phytophthora fragariae]|nr:hypothetical protein PF003_g24862 [Phytophthora fragariae]